MRTEPATVLRPGPVDAHGDQGPDTEHTIHVAVAPRTTSEDNDRGQSVVVGWDLFSTDPDLNVRSRDRVRLRGTVWDVIGEPARWTSGVTGRGRGAQVALGRLEG